MHTQIFFCTLLCRWQYSCADIDEMLKTSSLMGAQDLGSFKIIGFGFYSDLASPPQGNGFHIDEFTFSTEKRTFLFDDVSISQ